MSRAEVLVRTAHRKKMHTKIKKNGETDLET